MRKTTVLAILFAVLAGSTLSAQTISNQPDVTFEWDPVTVWNDGAAGYRFYISDVSGAGYKTIGTQVAAPAVQFQLVMGDCSTDGTLCHSNGTLRYYVVSAVNSLGYESGYSNEVALEFRVGPETPTNLVITLAGP